REEAAERGASVVAVEYYPPDNRTPQGEAARLAGIIKQEAAAHPGKVAVLIPERGVMLRQVAPLLRALSGTTPKEVRFLGTGLWTDPSVWREPALYGGVFPAPDPAAIDSFEQRYRAYYGEAPPPYASYGYDAGAMVARLASDGRLDAAMIQRQQG